MTRTALALSLLTLTSLGAGAAGSLAACSGGSGGGGAGPSDSGSDAPAADAAAGATFLPELPCTDSIDSIYADPGDVSAKPKGAILRCAKDKDMTAAELTAVLQPADGGTPYAGKALTSGAHVYRVLYRTERGDPKNTPGYSSAVVLLPETPRLGTGVPLPVVVSAHGSRGQGAECAPSRATPEGAYVQQDFWDQIYPLVGLGFPVIAPDLAGYANWGAPGNPPPTYDALADVGKSMLDGARALRRLVPHSVTNEVAITGHSAGGYTALAALDLADSYGADGVVSAVALYSPLWFSQRVWGVIFDAPTSFGFSMSSVGPVSLWYHYTHSYLLDGPDAALELFDPSKAAAVQGFVQNDCWAASYPDLEDAGTSVNDLFQKSYTGSVGLALGPLTAPDASVSSACQGDSRCETWVDRMTADYPHLTGGAAKVPILLWYANGDTTIGPAEMQCVLNRLSEDKVAAKVCYDQDAVGHGGVVSANADYVADWIAQQTLPDAGAPAQGHCTTLSPNDAGVPQLTADGGGAIPCNPEIPTQ